MATASDIIIDSFSRAMMRDSETSLTGDEIQTGLSLLNDMLAEWEPRYQLGFSPVAEITDEVRIPRHAHNTVKWNLAIRINTEFGRPLTQSLVASVADSLRTFEANLFFLKPVALPSTLPKGAGNECPDITDRRFFRQEDKDNF